jgi:gamma-glutamyl:cysteine ligase YbdK (ATP-grasp superfamily)
VRTPTADDTLGANDSGFASVRTPIFSMFPARSNAIPEPGFFWWDARLQPQLGTVEVRLPAHVSAAPSRAMRARRPSRA